MDPADDKSIDGQKVGKYNLTYLLLIITRKLMLRNPLHNCLSLNLSPHYNYALLQMLY